MKKSALALSLAIAALSFVVAPAPASTVTFDPSAAGLPGSAFTFDALHGVEVSRIENTYDMNGGFTTVENGFLQVTAATLGGSPVLTGLNVDYTLYYAFHITGSSASLALPGTIDGGTLTLYGVSGVSAFGIDPVSNVAYVDNGANSPVALVSSTVLGGHIGAVPFSFVPLLLDIFASLTSTVDPIVPGFIASPGFPLTAILDAAHDHTTVQISPDTTVFLVTGGPDVITFVPEPSTLAMLGIGVAAFAFNRRRLVSMR